MGDETTVAVARPQPLAGIQPTAIVPRSMDELGRMAAMIYKSRLAPKGLESPEAIGAAVMMGLEVGLSPMQAIQNIAVINGRPCVWGDAAIGLVRASGLLADFRETPIMEGEEVIGFECTGRRRGENHEITHRFTLQDAQRAGLRGKSGPWQQYPQRMCQMRARAWVLRDGFADVLKGLSVREETSDIGNTPVLPQRQAQALPEEVVVDRKGLPPPAEVDPLLADAPQQEEPKALSASSAADAAPAEAPAVDPAPEEHVDTETGEVTAARRGLISEVEYLESSGGADPVAPPPPELPAGVAGRPAAPASLEAAGDDLDGIELTPPPMTEAQRAKMGELRVKLGLQRGAAFKAWRDQRGLALPEKPTSPQATDVICAMQRVIDDAAKAAAKAAAESGFDRKAIISKLQDLQDDWAGADPSRLTQWEQALRARGLSALNWTKRASDESLAELVNLAAEIKG